MSRPYFSIVTINLNHATGLKRTLDSLRAQTCKDYQYIVIDGGSNDDSVQLIKNNLDIIDIWVSEPDNGVYFAMNKGLKKACGQYINFMNSGDAFANKDVLQKIKDLKNDSDIIVGRSILLAADGSMTESPMINSITPYGIISPFWNHQATFVKTSLHQRHLFDETMRVSADRKALLHMMTEPNCKRVASNDFYSIYELGGISATAESLYDEYWAGMKSALPECVYEDYRKIPINHDFMPLLEKLSSTQGLQTLAFRMLKALCTVYNCIKK